MINRYGWIKLPQIAKIERCRSGVVYPRHTIYIQVSACAKNSAEKWHITETAEQLPGKYAVVVPTVEVIPHYLKEALEYSAEEFFSRYVGCNINIQMELFQFYSLPFHSDLNEQVSVVNSLKPIKDDIEYTKQEIEAVKSVKEWFMGKLMI